MTLIRVGVFLDKTTLQEKGDGIKEKKKVGWRRCVEMPQLSQNFLRWGYVWKGSRNHWK